MNEKNAIRAAEQMAVFFVSQCSQLTAIYGPEFASLVLRATAFHLYLAAANPNAVADTFEEIAKVLRASPPTIQPATPTTRSN